MVGITSFALFFRYLGHTGIYLALLIFVSVLLCLTQIAFQIFLAVVGNDIIAKCEFLEILLRHVGLVRLDELDVIPIVQWLAPEVIAFVGSIIITIILRRSSAVNVQALNNAESGDGNDNNQAVPDVQEIGLEKWKILVKAGKILSLLALCATGALQPSGLSVVYYLVFLGSSTWWATNKQLERWNNIFSRDLLLRYIRLINELLCFEQGVCNRAPDGNRFYDVPHHRHSWLSKSLAARIFRTKLNDSKVGTLFVVKIIV